MSRGHSGRLAWLAVLLLIGRATPAAEPNAAGKVDVGLDSATQVYPVFVRMADQLISGGGEHERFCREHAGEKRRERRPVVVRTLREKADRSWEQVAKAVDRLEKSGGISDVQRYWIVNGFACRASGAACRELAGLDAVSFVYQERGPLHQQKRAARPGGGDVSPQLRDLFGRVADDWVDDSDEPWTTKGLDVSWNLKAIGADAAPPDRPLSKPDVTALFTGFAVWNRPDEKNGRWTIYSKEGDQMALVVGPGGNSFSGPHAAGVAGLMLSTNPDLNAWDVKAKMEQPCRDIGPKGRDYTFGAGLIRAAAAVKAARKP